MKGPHAQPEPHAAQPPSMQLTTAGFSMVVAVLGGLLLGFAGAKYAHWPLAVPLGLVLGFAAGMLSLIRQLGRV